MGDYLDPYYQVARRLLGSIGSLGPCPVVDWGDAGSGATSVSAAAEVERQPGQERGLVPEPVGPATGADARPSAFVHR
jgi:hypothetical protein